MYIATHSVQQAPPRSPFRNARLIHVLTCADPRPVHTDVHLPRDRHVDITRLRNNSRSTGIPEVTDEDRAKEDPELLATRYGALSAAVVARVRGASAADLDAIVERVFKASTLDKALGTALVVAA